MTSNRKMSLINPADFQDLISRRKKERIENLGNRNSRIIVV